MNTPVASVEQAAHAIQILYSNHATASDYLHSLNGVLTRAEFKEYLRASSKEEYNELLSGLTKDEKATLVDKAARMAKKRVAKGESVGGSLPPKDAAKEMFKLLDLAGQGLEFKAVRKVLKKTKKEEQPEAKLQTVSGATTAPKPVTKSEPKPPTSAAAASDRKKPKHTAVPTVEAPQTGHVTLEKPQVAKAQPAVNQKPRTHVDGKLPSSEQSHERKREAKKEKKEKKRKRESVQTQAPDGPVHQPSTEHPSDKHTASSAKLTGPHTAEPDVQHHAHNHVEGPKSSAGVLTLNDNTDGMTAAQRKRQRRKEKTRLWELSSRSASVATSIIPPDGHKVESPPPPTKRPKLNPESTDGIRNSIDASNAAQPSPLPNQIEVGAEDRDEDATKSAPKERRQRTRRRRRGKKTEAESVGAIAQKPSEPEAVRTEEPEEHVDIEMDDAPQLQDSAQSPVPNSSAHPEALSATPASIDGESEASSNPEDVPMAEPTSSYLSAMRTYLPTKPVKTWSTAKASEPLQQSTGEITTNSTSELLPTSAQLPSKADSVDIAANESTVTSDSGHENEEESHDDPAEDSQIEDETGLEEATRPELEHEKHVDDGTSEVIEPVEKSTTRVEVESAPSNVEHMAENVESELPSSSPIASKNGSSPALSQMKFDKPATEPSYPTLLGPSSPIVPTALRSTFTAVNSARPSFAFSAKPQAQAASRATSIPSHGDVDVPKAFHKLNAFLGRKKPGDFDSESDSDDESSSSSSSSEDEPVSKAPLAPSSAYKTSPATFRSTIGGADKPTTSLPTNSQQDPLVSFSTIDRRNQTHQASLTPELPDLPTAMDQGGYIPAPSSDGKATPHEDDAHVDDEMHEADAEDMEVDLVSAYDNASQGIAPYEIASPSHHSAHSHGEASEMEVESYASKDAESVPNDEDGEQAVESAEETEAAVLVVETDYSTAEEQAAVSSQLLGEVSAEPNENDGEDVPPSGQTPASHLGEQSSGNVEVQPLANVSELSFNRPSEQDESADASDERSEGEESESVSDDDSSDDDAHCEPPHSPSPHHLETEAEEPGSPVRDLDMLDDASSDAWEEGKDGDESEEDRLTELHTTQVDVESKSPRKLRKTTKMTSEHFTTPSPSKKRVPAGTSAVPFPKLCATRFGLIQEELASDPFRLLIAVTFLNKTAGHTAVPVYRQLMEQFPTPAALALAEESTVSEMIRSLGLQNQRARKLIRLAKIWLESPPEKGRRYRAKDYPSKGDHSTMKADEVLEGDTDEIKGALEIAHIYGLGPYAWDSWRIFCRDVFRGVATGYNGEGVEGYQPYDSDSPSQSGFEPEWKRVVPLDKELRACLRWMWLKEGWEWDPLTGNKKPASLNIMREASAGAATWDEPAGEDARGLGSDEPEAKIMENAAVDTVVAQETTEASFPSVQQSTAQQVAEEPVEVAVVATQTQVATRGRKRKLQDVEEQEANHGALQSANDEMTGVEQGTLSGEPHKKATPSPPRKRVRLKDRMMPSSAEQPVSSQVLVSTQDTTTEQMPAVTPRTTRSRSRQNSAQTHFLGVVHSSEEGQGRHASEGPSVLATISETPAALSKTKTPRKSAPPSTPARSSRTLTSKPKRTDASPLDPNADDTIKRSPAAAERYGRAPGDDVRAGGSPSSRGTVRTPARASAHGDQTRQQSSILRSSPVVLINNKEDEKSSAKKRVSFSVKEPSSESEGAQASSPNDQLQPSDSRSPFFKGSGNENLALDTPVAHTNWGTPATPSSNKSPYLDPETDTSPTPTPSKRTPTLAAYAHRLEHPPTLQDILSDLSKQETDPLSTTPLLQSKQRLEGRLRVKTWWADVERRLDSEEWKPDRFWRSRGAAAGFLDVVCWVRKGGPGVGGSDYDDGVEEGEEGRGSCDDETVVGHVEESESEGSSTDDDDDDDGDAASTHDTVRPGAGDTADEQEENEAEGHEEGGEEVISESDNAITAEQTTAHNITNTTHEHEHEHEHEHQHEHETDSISAQEDSKDSEEDDVDVSQLSYHNREKSLEL